MSEKVEELLGTHANHVGIATLIVKDMGSAISAAVCINCNELVFSSCQATTIHWKYEHTVESVALVNSLCSRIYVGRSSLLC